MRIWIWVFNWQQCLLEMQPRPGEPPEEGSCGKLQTVAGKCQPRRPLRTTSGRCELLLPHTAAIAVSDRLAEQVVGSHADGTRGLGFSDRICHVQRLPTPPLGCKSGGPSAAIESKPVVGNKAATRLDRQPKPAGVRTDWGASRRFEASWRVPCRQRLSEKRGGPPGAVRRKI